MSVSKSRSDLRKEHDVEKVKYAGLRIEDFDILASAKRNGFHVQWLDSVDGVVHINEALAQIAEMESKTETNYCRVGDVTVEVGATTSTPLTWNERINQMSADEKGEFFATFDCRMTFDEDYDCGKHKGCKPCMIDFFNSPYTEGATDEG